MTQVPSDPELRHTNASTPGSESLPGSSSEAWSVIIGSIQQPLGLITLLLLIINVFLAAGTATGNVPYWLPSSLFVLVFLLIFFLFVTDKTLLLYHPKDWPNSITIALVFGHESDIPPELDTDNCDIKVTNQEGKVVAERKTVLSRGMGGWTLRLNPSAFGDYKISNTYEFLLRESSGILWRAGPFSVDQRDIPVRLITNRETQGL